MNRTRLSNTVLSYLTIFSFFLSAFTPVPSVNLTQSRLSPGNPISALFRFFAPSQWDDRVLDNFDRHDGDLGENWSATNDYSIRSQQMQMGKWANLWAKEPFQPAQEAFLTFGNVTQDADQLGLLLKAQSTTDDNPQAIYVFYAPNANPSQVTVRVFDTDYGFTQIGDGIPAAFSSGDILGARVFSNGDLTLYKNDDQIGTADLSNWLHIANPGYIGVYANISDATSIDNFGGGAVTFVIEPTAVSTEIAPTFENTDVAPTEIVPTAENTATVVSTEEVVPSPESTETAVLTEIAPTPDSTNVVPTTEPTATVQATIEATQTPAASYLLALTATNPELQTGEDANPIQWQVTSAETVDPAAHVEWRIRFLLPETLSPEKPDDGKYDKKANSFEIPFSGANGEVKFLADKKASEVEIQAQLMDGESVISTAQPLKLVAGISTKIHAKDGGMVKEKGGKATLNIPANALPKDASITISIPEHGKSKNGNFLPSSKNKHH